MEPGDAANAVINFNENNLYNSEATITADNIDQAWPSTHETADGGSVSAATAQNSTVLKQQATYTNIGWDFDEIWKMDEGSYGYPVLRIFSKGLYIVSVKGGKTQGSFKVLNK